MEAGETSLGGLEMLNCYRNNCSETAVKLFSFADVCDTCSGVHMSTLVYTVWNRQETDQGGWASRCD